MNIDPYILAFSAVTVFVTIWMGFRSAKTSKTASDFFVAGRSVSVGWNASAISGEYLSAASFMGVAGMVMSSGYDALWYPVCYACGYLFLLLFIAGPLRRFGAYTIPDFAEGRFDSPLFRKIAVVFVLFIGFFYTMPQMKGAGTTLAYIFPGLPYWAGVVLVGAVITLNVALGGMKGITLVQAFQYWIKMFAISVPIFVLMAVYGHYGDQLMVVGKKASTAIAQEMDPEKQVVAFRKPLPEKAPADATWLNPFGPLTTKAAKAAFAGNTNTVVRLRSGVAVEYDVIRTSDIVQRLGQRAADVWHEQIAKDFTRAKGQESFVINPEGGFFDLDTMLKAYWSGTEGGTSLRAKSLSGHKISATGMDGTNKFTYSNLSLGPVTFEGFLAARGVVILKDEPFTIKAVPAEAVEVLREADLRAKPYALLYTYSLIIAIVCGTAGLPHILVRFYTNPDGVAAKRTTMWVMILIGVFYVFPPVFGVIGRNLLPELYSGVGAKGTDKIVLELPRIISERYGVLGSILSGITCAGAFAAFMSTFSGLLVSMTGALAHDVYGRMLNPKASAEQRMKMFKWCAVLIGGVAVLLGSFVEPLEINFMVGQAFAIAAASYFPLLFMAVWWRKLTMKGAATGMLAGGLSALIGISLTSFSTLASAPGKTGELFALFKPLNDFWAAHPLLRILCEQPAIWAVPLAIILMVIVSKLTSKDVPEDIRMKMLVLHAPEKLGLKQEYIQEHQPGH